MTNCEIWVLNGKLSKANADAIIVTIDPDRMFMRKIDREIRRSQSGHGRAYYAQLPKERIDNLDAFIARGDYESRVISDEQSRKTCECPHCINYDEYARESGQILLCSPDTEKAICRLAPKGCICQKCRIYEKYYLLRQYYCMAERAPLVNTRRRPDIIFVSDKYISRLSDVVLSGLSTAEKTGYKNIAFPPLRFEVMWKEVEKNDKEKCMEIAEGIRRFFVEYPNVKMESIKIIVDDDHAASSELILEIEKHKLLKSMLKNRRPGIVEPLKTMATKFKRSIFRK